ncbi:hypothetical protein [Paraburkholderia sp. WSM4174]|uniref:hypothetical protein n=1 Tax=Paraburkholderia sp. WSM4174 TaxID=2991071 RepID=UPI003D1C21B6
MIWHSLLTHRGSPRNDVTRSRRSAVFHFFELPSVFRLPEGPGLCSRILCPLSRKPVLHELNWRHEARR